MYEAKESRRGHRELRRRARPLLPGCLALLAELRTAIDSDQLVLALPAQGGLAQDRVIGVEALVRWEHPTRGLLGPGEFLPLAERTGLVPTLTRWACGRRSRSGRLARDGLDLPVAVNLAAANIVDVTLP